MVRQASRTGPDGGPTLIMQSVRVATGDSEERRHAFLVYADDALIAVLAQPEHAVAKEFGKTWVLHAGFGPCSGSGPKVWHDLGEIHRWIRDRLRPPEAVSARRERTMTHLSPCGAFSIIRPSTLKPASPVSSRCCRSRGLGRPGMSSRRRR